eukprot:COSAG06_NODE_78_length_25492_cov_189.998307_12_plen_79_part_00
MVPPQVCTDQRYSPSSTIPKLTGGMTCTPTCGIRETVVAAGGDAGLLALGCGPADAGREPAARLKAPGIDGVGGGAGP